MLARAALGKALLINSDQNSEATRLVRDGIQLVEPIANRYKAAIWRSDLVDLLEGMFHCQINDDPKSAQRYLRSAIDTQEGLCSDDPDNQLYKDRLGELRSKLQIATQDTN